MDATTKRPRPTPSTNANAMIATTTDKRPAAKATTKKTAKKPPATATTTPKTRAVAVRRPKLIWRTRDQENSRLYNLQLDVAGLQSELQGLREYRTMLMSRAMNRPDDADGSFMRTVREYFHVFRHGYTPDPQANTRPRMLALMPDEVTPDVFVHQVMDEHVCIGRFAGLAQMMKQWERYSSVFGPMTLSFLDAEILSSFRGRDEGHEQVLVTARAQYHLYISLRTIEIMFPHILRQQEIVTKVLGRRITGVGKFDFVFDVTNNRIVRYEFSLDLTASFIDLLGDPEMVAEILKDALISDEFFIGDLSEFHPDADAPISIVSISQPEEPQGTNNESNEEPLETPHAPEVQPWKMTISSILSPVDDDEDASEVRDGDVTMDESEPYAEQAPDDDIPAHGMYVRFHRD